MKIKWNVAVDMLESKSSCSWQIGKTKSMVKWAIYDDIETHTENERYRDTKKIRWNKRGSLRFTRNCLLRIWATTNGQHESNVGRMGRHDKINESFYTTKTGLR